MRPEPKPFDRKREVTRTQRLIERLHSPRLAMATIAMLTAAVGFIASFGLLHAGVHAMALRYPLAVIVAYGAFLGFLWCWLHWQSNPGDDHIDIADTGIDCLTSDGSGGSVSAAADSAGDAAGGGSWLDAIDGEGAFLLVIIAAVVAVLGLAFAAFSIVSAAPVLLAELVVDAALANGLYRRVRSIDAGRHWLKTAFVRTVWRFVAVAVIAGVAGAVMQAMTPGATSIGQIFH